MKIIKIVIILFVLLICAGGCYADVMTDGLVLKRQIQSQPLVQVPDNNVYVQTTQTSSNETVEDENFVMEIEPQEIIPVSFREYVPNKGEVVFGSTRNIINAINPNWRNNKAGSGFPGGRGANQLIVYTPDYGERTNTNEFGAEAVVVGNIVTELTGADSFIPKDGIVISGHGQAKKWINSTLAVGTKVYIDKETNFIYTYTTSESFIFETEKKIAEAEHMLNYYKSANQDFNWKLPSNYINDARELLNKAKKHPDEVQKYSQAAIEAANEALKCALPFKKGELKGVWVRPTETSEKSIIATLDRIQRAGIDNVFLETYFHGKTIYPSKIMEGYGFTPQYEQFVGIDPLAIWIKEAHKRGIKVHTWFETFYVGNENPEYNPQSILTVNPSWSNRTKKDTESVSLSKSTAEHNGYFLDPANPYVQDFLTKLIEEIVANYKPDGINLDYIRYPNSTGTKDAANWGYTEFARNDFFMIYGVDPVAISTNDPMWTEWSAYRREQVTNMVKKVGQIGRRTNTYISAVIFPDRLAALTSKQQDWKTWSTRNYINAFTPLFLTCDSKTANKMMSDVLKAKSYNTDFYAGLFVTFMGGADEDLIRQIHEARKVNAKGVILFDYAHLNDKYINALSKSVFARQIPKQYTQPVQEKRKGWWIFGG